MTREKDPEVRFEARAVGWAPPPPQRRITGAFHGARFETDGQEHVSFRDADVEDVDFSGNSFWGFWADESRFRACDFRNVGFEHVPRFGNNLGSVYTDCSFDGARLDLDGDLGRVRFERCTFDGAEVRRWFSFVGEFVDCRCRVHVPRHGTVVGPALLDRLFRRPLRKNEFRGNDFRPADLSWTTFTRGINIAAQLWPEGEEYLRVDRWPERLARVRSELRARPASQQRELLRALELYGESWEGQQEVFARRSDEPGSAYDEVERLIESAL